jgi:hypothetical protein
MRSNFELQLSFFVVLILTTVYVVYALVAIPAGGHPFGRALGILGALLMLSTEVLYSARKRWRIFRFGQVRSWLSFHIFTGIVGPALILMHTGMAFRGLAGLTMLLTVIVVASGFLGRYIYTAVPRTMAGREVDRRSLQAQVQRQQQQLTTWSDGKTSRVQALVQAEMALTSDGKDLSPGQVLTGRLREWRDRRRLRRAIRKLDKEEQARLVEIELLLRRQHRLARQINSLQTVRRMMGWWHTLHVPLGLTLFSAMFIHILATIYYG